MESSKSKSEPPPWTSRSRKRAASQDLPPPLKLTELKTALRQHHESDATSDASGAGGELQRHVEAVVVANPSTAASSWPRVRQRRSSVTFTEAASLLDCQHNALTADSAKDKLTPVSPGGQQTEFDLVETVFSRVVKSVDSSHSAPTLRFELIEPIPDTLMPREGARSAASVDSLGFGSSSVERSASISSIDSFELVSRQVTKSSELSSRHSIDSYASSTRRDSLQELRTKVTDLDLSDFGTFIAEPLECVDGADATGMPADSYNVGGGLPSMRMPIASPLSTAEAGSLVDRGLPMLLDSPSSMPALPSPSDVLGRLVRQSTQGELIIDDQRPSVPKGTEGFPAESDGPHPKSKPRKDWTAEEDRIIASGVQQHGCKWRLIKAQLPGRSEDSVRNRWTRLSRSGTPSVKRIPKALAEDADGSSAAAEATEASKRAERTAWRADEDALIVQTVSKIGKRWGQTSLLLPGRTDHAIRNRYARLCYMIQDDPACLRLDEETRQQLQKLLSQEQRVDAEVPTAPLLDQSAEQARP